MFVFDGLADDQDEKIVKLHMPGQIHVVFYRCFNL